MKNELTVIERAAVALNTVEHEKSLIEMSKKYTDIIEIKNGAGREQTHAAYMALKGVRVSMEKTGKAARDDATAFSKAVIAEEKRLIAIIEPEEIRLMGLRDTWDAERAAEKEAIRLAEIKRIEAIQAKITAIRKSPMDWIAASSADIGAAADRVAALEIYEEEFGEFSGEAFAERAHAEKTLLEMQEAARLREVEDARIAAERAELARLRAEQEAREHVAAMDRAAAEEAARKEREAEQQKLNEQRAELARQQAAIDAQKAEQERLQREAAAAELAKQVAAQKEAACLENEKRQQESFERNKEKLEAERRARTQFVLNGPDPVELVQTIAEAYQVSDMEALAWITRHNWAEVEITA